MNFSRGECGDNFFELRVLQRPKHLDTMHA